jgi:hypothetical protein
MHLGLEASRGNWLHDGGCCASRRLRWYAGIGRICLRGLCRLRWRQLGLQGDSNYRVRRNRRHRCCGHD